MLQLLFTVRVNTNFAQKIKVVGSIKELGLWNPEKALQLNFHKDVWQGGISIDQPQKRVEFKLIKVKPNRQIDWQQLPNNANRRFKPKFSTQFHLEWSKPAGKVNSISNFSYKLKGLPAVIIKKTKQDQDHRKKIEEFDPYSIAHNNQDTGESDQEQFLLVKRKMSDQIGINSTDLEEIYYKNSAVEIFCGLLKKIKVYVITKDLEQSISLHAQIEEELGKLPPNYLPRWITQEYFFKKNFCSKLKRRASIFEVDKQEMMLQTLYSRTSFFILLQIQVALSLGKELQKVACCLYLPSQQYKSAIQNLNKFLYIDLICFDSIQANRQFYQYLRSRSSLFSGEQSETISDFKEVPSIEFIVQELQRLRQRGMVIVASIDNITQDECLQNLTKPNTISIIDYSIITQHPSFAQKVFDNMGQHSMYLIVSDTKTSRMALQFKQEKDVVFIYDNFEKILIQGKEYFPIRSFEEIVDQIKLKSKIFKESIGGQIIQRENSLIYIVPQSKMQIALKLQLEFLKYIKKFSFAKVSRKGLRVKVSWILSKQIRMLRTLCQIKVTNYGRLGDFNLLSTQTSLKDLRSDIRLLIEHEPSFFRQEMDTQIRYYSFSEGKKFLSLVPQNLQILNTP